MDRSMNLKVEKVLSSRIQGGGDDKKVRIEVVYHKRKYKEAPVPGGFVVDTSSGSFSALTVDLRDDIKQSIQTKLFNVIFSLGLDSHLERRLINEMTSALVSLPDPMILNGVKIMPELFVQIDLDLYYRMQIFPRSSLPSSSSSTTTSSSSSRIGMWRRSNDIDDDVRALMRSWLMNNRFKELERIRFMEVEEENWRCSLCLESESRQEEVVIRLRCKHVFHNDCIVKWIVKSNSCPLCRATVS